MGRRGPSCGTCCQKVWTFCFILTWLLLVAGTVLCHLAVASLIGPLQRLPSSLRTGFDTTLGFSQLNSSAMDIQAAAAAALDACGAKTSQCPTPPAPVPASRAGNTQAQKDRILAAFAASLGKVLKVTTDKYLGIDGFAETAEQLQNISAAVMRLNTSMSCEGTNPQYCGIHATAVWLGVGASDATDELEKFTDSQAVREFEARGDQLKAIHALPYLLLLSMLFFLVFWWRDAACCCCGGTCVGCVALVLHLLLWIAFFALTTAIVAAGLALKYGRERVRLTGVVRGNPMLGEFLDHVQAAFPEFWALVFQPLSAPAEQLFQASFVLWACCMLLALYGSCLCCCRPYTRKHDEATLVKIVC